MWYASSTGFVLVDNRPEPLYEIKYAHSADGIIWVRPNITCIPPLEKYQCTARPAVLKENDLYKMWFTYRGSVNYRDGNGSYRIGYAESINAINWERKDSLAGIEYSKVGWDSKMQTYPSVLKIKDEKYLFYNGNGFGKTGIGLARWITK